MRRIHDDGLFEATIPAGGGDIDYGFVVVDGEGGLLRLRDPYAFTQPWFTDEDEDLFVSGQHVRLFEKLGARPICHGNTKGVGFAVWAPHAQRVSVVGTFNRWDGRCHQMRRVTASGVWDCFIPGVQAGDLYKFEIRTSQGAVFLKADPFAFQTEAPPQTASIVHGGDWARDWLDAQWVNGRAQTIHERGFAIHRIDPHEHLASTEDAGRAPSLRELATESFFASVLERGFSHVELASLSSGHQGSASAFAPAETYGTPQDVMAFIDACHQRGIGVIVPGFQAHLPETLTDLAWFDGEPLYEDADAQEGSARALFATSKGEIRSFLLSNAVFWLDRYHCDGLRTDRRAAELYRQLVQPDREEWAGVKLVVREPVAETTLSEAEVDRLVTARHDDPHSILGPHYSDPCTLTLRALIPDGEQVCACFAAQPEMMYELQRVHPWIIRDNASRPRTRGWLPALCPRHRLGTRACSSIPTHSPTSPSLTSTCTCLAPATTIE